MVFHSPTFLFIFLPVFLLLYYLAAPRFRNLIALCASLLFFAAGEVVYLPLLLGLIWVTYALGRRLEAARETPAARRLLLAGVVINIGVLALFKIFNAYGSGWAPGLPDHLPMPLGLSYVAFQMVAYLIDINNEIHDSEPSFLNFALYGMLFPKIITGPIARYRDLAPQLAERPVTAQSAASGARRFITGLAKKILIADTLARVVDPAFGLPSPAFSTGVAWVVVVGFALQLYFDFSGYIDMAIGLGQMLGFRFVENFNYPYISRSISDFWRRWHISLSTWFRDYVFYPLEFTRKRSQRWRQQLHTLIVFLLTGLWHGLTLNFVLWGLLHGLALALEMTGFGRWLKKVAAPVQHGYALAVILLGWVFFRSPTPAYALALVGRLFGSRSGLEPPPFSTTMPLPVIETSVWLALAAGLVLALPVLPALRRLWERVMGPRAGLALAGTVTVDAALLFLMLAAIAAASSRALVASIYGGF